MALNPKTEALAFRIWAHCEPRSWNLNMSDLADALGESTHRVRMVVQKKGWLSRLRASKTQYVGNPDFFDHRGMPT